MNIVIEQRANQELEIVLRCKNPDDDEVIKLKHLLEALDKKILVSTDCSRKLLATRDIVYCEYVNRRVFVYTKKDLFVTALSLAEIEKQSHQLFRCSKNTIVNLKEITHFQSEINGNILVTLSTEEKILVSRHYASKLRKKLRER